MSDSFEAQNEQMCQQWQQVIRQHPDMADYDQLRILADLRELHANDCETMTELEEKRAQEFIDGFNGFVGNRYRELEGNLRDYRRSAKACRDTNGKTFAALSAAIVKAEQEMEIFAEYYQMVVSGEVESVLDERAAHYALLRELYRQHTASPTRLP